MIFLKGSVEDDFFKKQRTNGIGYLYGLYLESCLLNIKESARISQEI